MSFSREQWLDEWMKKHHGGWNPVTRRDVLKILRDFQRSMEGTPKAALKTLKNVFLGNGKPLAPAEALRCLEAALPRVEADPGNWWNRPETHESEKT